MTLSYSVRSAFKAMDPISGRERSLGLGDTLTCNTGQAGESILVKVNGLSLFGRTRHFQGLLCPQK